MGPGVVSINSFLLPDAFKAIHKDVKTTPWNYKSKQNECPLVLLRDNLGEVPRFSSTLLRRKSTSATKLDLLGRGNGYGTFFFCVRFSPRATVGGVIVDESI